MEFRAAIPWVESAYGIARHVSFAKYAMFSAVWAYLRGALATGIGRRVPTTSDVGGCGGRKNGESEGSDCSETREHCELGSVAFTTEVVVWAEDSGELQQCLL